MPLSEDPPLTEYQQTVQDFIALLQALRAWRKVINLYYQGRLIGRATVNFAGLMQKSSHPEITIVDHFDDDPNVAIWRKANTPPAPTAPAAADPVPDEDYPEPLAPPRIVHRVLPPDPAKPSQPIDWAALYGTNWDFSDPEGPFLGALSPERVNAGLAALTRILAAPLPTWPADLAKLIGPHLLPEVAIDPGKLLSCLDAVTALGNALGNPVAGQIQALPEPATAGLLDANFRYQPPEQSNPIGAEQLPPPDGPQIAATTPDTGAQAPDFSNGGFLDPQLSNLAGASFPVLPSSAPSGSGFSVLNLLGIGSAQAAMPPGGVFTQPVSLAGPGAADFSEPLFPSPGDFLHQAAVLGEGGVNAISELAVGTFKALAGGNEINTLLENGVSLEDARQQAATDIAGIGTGEIFPPANDAEAAAQRLGGVVLPVLLPAGVGFLSKAAGLLTIDLNTAAQAENGIGTLVDAAEAQGASDIVGANTGIVSTNGLSSGGPTEIVARDSVDLSAFERLNNPDPATGQPRPGEAGAAAELEGYLGGTLDRSANPSIDFVFTSGENVGKTVDFLLTPNSFTQAAKINRFFEQNLSGFADTLQGHAEVADIVPIDTRFLSESNQQFLMELIDNMSPKLQHKIILLK